MDTLYHKIFPPATVNPLHYVQVNGSLLLASLSILFNPVFWNIVAQNEYRNHSLEKIFRSPYLGCYVLAATIFTLGLFRDNLYNVALSHQPVYPYLDYGEVKVVAALMMGWGTTLVLSSMWALGVTGTYLGDYFGILMKEQVKTFPFNVSAHPMYLGSTLVFLGSALYQAKIAGILLSAQVYAEYLVAEVYFEEPYTVMIYSNNSNSPKRSGRGRKALEEKSI